MRFDEGTHLAIAVFSGALKIEQSGDMKTIPCIERHGKP